MSVAQIIQDVNDAIFKALTPNSIEKNKFKTTLVPEDWVGEDGWRLQLTDIRRELKKKYPALLIRPTTDQVKETHSARLTETRRQLVAEVRALP